MRRVIVVAVLSVPLLGVAWLGAMALGFHDCSGWLPLSCGGADPELTRLIR